MLRFEKESEPGILHDFICGIDAMDDFIHGDLGVFLKKDPSYQFFVVREDSSGEIIAMYVISNGIFIDYDNQFSYLPFGQRWGYLDDELELHEGTMFPTLEIDYLAVRKDIRGRGYGKRIISELNYLASQKGLFFITVEAYYEHDYSAIPFYEKSGFFPLQEISSEENTIRMALRVTSDNK